MRSLVAVENVSLDGVMQAPGRPDEDTRGGFAHGGWASAALAADPAAAQASTGGLAATTGLVLGRRTYLDLLGHWTSTPEPNPFAEVLLRTPKHVASSTLADPLPYPATTLLGPDPVAGVRRLKADGEGDLVLLGSGQLVRALAAADLVDRYVLTVVPVVLGLGARLFDGRYTELEVERTVATPTGIVVGTYAVRRPG
ncbi:Dihydrofolate reductase [Friedmanniella luteola]|uniref:Dihydrofolate reductase n=1 Tax=Friedmanniella luteola TaxID=546871 RepID=A0A1H1LR69_9ACTN|nr:dihydrofolate reductase family protein [Friedmanniella luteola]SDR76309.1 Dihydrofolate reductase [Friedmanniella luteola]